MKHLTEHRCSIQRDVVRRPFIPDDGHLERRDVFLMLNQNRKFITRIKSVSQPGNTKGSD